MERIFVTGGAGFIGRAVVRHLRERGDEVRAAVRDPARARTLRDLGVRLVKGDLGSVADVRDQMAGCASGSSASTWARRSGPPMT